MTRPLSYYSPPKRSPLLVAVAWIFIAFGLLAAIHILWSGFRLKPNLNIALLYLPVGLGLLRRNATAKKVALMFLIIQICLCAAFALFTILAFITGSRLTGHTLSFPTFALTLATSLSLLILACWQFQTLHRPDIRALFEHQGTPT